MFLNFNKQKIINNNNFNTFLICFNFFTFFINSTILNSIFEYKFFIVSSVACLTSISTIVLLLKLNNTLDYFNLMSDLTKQKNLSIQELIEQKKNFFNIVDYLVLNNFKFFKTKTWSDLVGSAYDHKLRNDPKYFSKLKNLTNLQQESEFLNFGAKLEKNIFQELDLTEETLIEFLELNNQKFEAICAFQKISLNFENGLFFDNPENISLMFQTLLLN